MIRMRPIHLVWMLLLISSFTFAADNSPHYWRVGNAQDVTTPTTPAYALMGGGSDQDEAFKFLCDHSGGGDFLILTASGDDAYNPYIQKLCHQNSVATLRVPNAEAANDPHTADLIRHAEALFITGGDQANYVNYWKPSPMRDAIQDLIRHGVPIGGTSAGLAILGEFDFAALHDTAYSEETLKNPYNEGVTIDHGFLSVPHLENVITDTHFKKRDRLGRTLGFMARILQDGEAKDIRSIAVDEKSVVLLNADGSARVIGQGTGAYFYHPTAPPEVCKPGVPLTFMGINVYHVPTGGTFNLVTWSGEGGQAYTLNVENGEIRSSTGSKY